MFFKGVLVVSSLAFCGVALFASPPTPEDMAEWKGAAARGASRLGRSVLSAALNALPSSGDVARYARTAWMRAESFAVAELGNALEPNAPPQPEPSGATPECRASELDELLKSYERQSGTMISREDIECPPDATLPRPWCDPRVQAVLRLIEEDRARRGEALPPSCDVAQLAPPPRCE
jgi:hypothetical protein